MCLAGMGHLPFLLWPTFLHDEEKLKEYEKLFPKQLFPLHLNVKTQS